MLLLKHHSLIVTSSLRGFNFSRYSVTWLLSNIVFWEGFSSMTRAFSDIDDLFPDFVKHISSTSGLHCSRAVCWFYWGSCLSLIVICKDFLGFYFPFSQVSLNSNFILLFPEIGDKCSSIFDIVTHKTWVCHRLNVFKLPRMFCSNHRSLMISVDDLKNIHLRSTFSTFEFFILQVKTIQKLIRILLILLQMLVTFQQRNSRYTTQSE